MWARKSTLITFYAIFTYQQGTSSAMFLFSSLVVVPSKIPSLFFIKLLTGNVSPLSKFMLSLKVNF